MANPEHLAILKQGVEQWNKWRDEHRDVRPDLSELNLDGMNLCGADLSDANLWLTDFPKANLSESKLSRSNLLLGNLAGRTSLTPK